MSSPSANQKNKPCRQENCLNIRIQILLSMSFSSTSTPEKLFFRALPSCASGGILSPFVSSAKVGGRNIMKYERGLFPFFFSSPSSRLLFRIPAGRRRLFWALFRERSGFKIKTLLSSWKIAKQLYFLTYRLANFRLSFFTFLPCLEL